MENEAKRTDSQPKRHEAEMAECAPSSRMDVSKFHRGVYLEPEPNNLEKRVRSCRIQLFQGVRLRKPCSDENN